MADRGGGDVPLGGRLERQVLCALAVHDSVGCSLDQLIDAAYGGQAVDGGALRVQNHVSRLRKRLGHDSIVSKAGRYRLNPTVISTDTARFESSLATGRASPDLTVAAHTLAEAIELWRGPPFGELPDWPDAVAGSQRLRRMLALAREALVTVYIIDGRPLDALDVVETMLAEGPAVERGWEWLMIARERSGDHVGATGVFQQARAGLAEVGLDPSPSLTALDRAIVSGDSARLDRHVRDIGSTLIASQGASAAIARTPRPATRWFGDRATITSCVELVRERNLVTLLGVGGVGKTRLATEVCLDLAGAFDHGTAFVDLSSVTSAEDVALAVATALAMTPESTGTMSDMIADRLRDRRMLLVLDNCEHVRAGAADVVKAINARTRTVSVLATSREPLKLPLECVVQVRPLSGDDAAELFRDRVRLVDQSVRFGAAEDARIANLCDVLGGVPLAIELAAGRIRSATTTELVSQIAADVGVLEDPNRVGRFGSVIAGIEWSFSLLTEPERAALERLCVFSGPFDATDAAAVMGVDRTSRSASILARLVDTSMLSTDRRGRSVRFAILDVIRQNGLRRLETSGALVEALDAHLRRVIAVVEASASGRYGPDQADLDDALDMDWPNVRSAVGWARRQGDFHSASRIVIGIGPFSLNRMRLEAGEWASALVADFPQVPPELYGIAAGWAMYAGQHQVAIDLARRSAHAGCSPDDPRATLARAFGLVSMLASGRLEDLLAAVEHLDRTTHACTDEFARAWSIGARCHASYIIGPERHDGYVRELEADAARTGAPWLRLQAAYYRTMQETFIEQRDDLSLAAARSRRAVHEARHVRDRHMVGHFMLLSLFVSLMSGAVPEPRDITDSIAELYETRNWMMLWLSVESAATTLARVGETDAAATIESFLTANDLHWKGNLPWTAMRERALPTSIFHAPELAESVVAGQLMSAENLLRFTTDALRACQTDTNGQAR